MFKDVYNKRKTLISKAYLAQLTRTDDSTIWKYAQITELNVSYTCDDK